MVVATIATLITAACNSNTTTEKTESPAQTQVTSEGDEGTSSTQEVNLSITEIDSIRAAIELLETEAIEISTANLREKIKQKWSRLHYYVQNEEVVKIKTYPYDGTSKRTEEFYANEDGLVLVVIEDNGDGPKGKSKDAIDKMYYFSNGELVQELKMNEKQEYSIRESDAEELQSEFNEYLEILKQQE